MDADSPALRFEVIANWGSHARASRLYLPHAGLSTSNDLHIVSALNSSKAMSSGSHISMSSNMSSDAGAADCSLSASQAVRCPVFMPVGTQGTMKGVLHHDQLCGAGSLLGEDNDCRLILGNTYHLGHRPGRDVLDAAGGLHHFMNWPNALLTDSGGFQMVSLLRLAQITEQGVNFRSPHDGSEMMLTPEQSMDIQNSIGADIMMALDDVVHTSTTGSRVEEAMERSIRWLDRCIAAHKRPREQNLFAIVQGGLDAGLRDRCLDAMLMPSRDAQIPGYAIGGLSGGESKDSFWRVVAQCTARLPKHKPRYLMGVGYALDLVVCSSLGVDMFDCVFPSRTARFGTALVPEGNMHLRSMRFASDYRPIDDNCRCDTCLRYSRSYLHNIARTDDTQSAQLLTVHNISFQMRLMREIRSSIIDGSLDTFVKDFMRRQFHRDPEGMAKDKSNNRSAGDGVDKMIDADEPMHACGYPKWAVDALLVAGIDVTS